MTYDEFTKATGREPINDDLERANCAKAGQAGHHCCGICGVCFLPRFECKCQKLKEQAMNEKLTPIYGILLAGKSPEYNYPMKRDKHGIFHQVPLTEKQALQTLTDLEKEGKGARAYHYGWKERGFQTHEKPCTELARNKYYN